MGQAVPQAELQRQGNRLTDLRREGSLWIGLDGFPQCPEAAAIKHATPFKVAEAGIGKPAFPLGEPLAGFEHSITEGAGGVVLLFSRGLRQSKILRPAMLHGQEVFQDFLHQGMAVVRHCRLGAALQLI